MLCGMLAVVLCAGLVALCATGAVAVRVLAHSCCVRRICCRCGLRVCGVAVTLCACDCTRARVARVRRLCGRPCVIVQCLKQLAAFCRAACALLVCAALCRGCWCVRAPCLQCVPSCFVRMRCTRQPRVSLPGQRRCTRALLLLGASGCVARVQQKQQTNNNVPGLSPKPSAGACGQWNHTR